MARGDSVEATEAQSKATADALSFLDQLQPSTLEDSKKLSRGGGGGNRGSKWEEFITTFMDRSRENPEQFGVVRWPGLDENSNPTLVAVVAGINSAKARHKEKTGEELPIAVKSSKADKVVFIINTDVASAE